MSLELSLAAVPNQSIEMTLEGSRYTIAFKACFDFMAVTITRDSETIVSGMRCVAGGLLIPFDALYEGFGNFLILTNNDEIPYYDKFGINQFLMYMTVADIEAAKNGA